MTAAITVVYLVVIAFTVSGELTINDGVKGVIEHFTWVVGAVIVFYFGSKAVLQYVGKKKEETETLTKQEQNDKNLATLKERLAKGEVKKEDYDELKKEFV